jgi:hypothetical protein
MPAPAALHPLRRVFNLVLPHLGSVYPLQLGRALRPTEPPALFAGRLATAIGLTGVQVAVEGDVPAAAGVGDPVPLQVAPDLASEPRSARFRFWVGRALAFAALGGSLTEQLPDRELGELFEALFVQRPIDAVVAQLRKQAMRAIPRKTRKALEQLEPPRSDADYWKSYRLFVRRRSDEVGLLLCGDPRVALAELTGGDGSKLEGGQYRQLLNFMVSEEYGNFYRSLWSSTLTG